MAELAVVAVLALVAGLILGGGLVLLYLDTLEIGK